MSTSLRIVHLIIQSYSTCRWCVTFCYIGAAQQPKNVLYKHVCGVCVLIRCCIASSSIGLGGCFMVTLAGITLYRYGLWRQVGVGKKERDWYCGVYIIVIDYRFSKSWTHLPPYLLLENVLSIRRTKHFAVVWRVRGKGRIKRDIMESGKVSRRWVYMGRGRDWRLAVVMRCGGLKSYWIPFLCHVQKGNKKEKKRNSRILETFVNVNLTNTYGSASPLFLFSCIYVISTISQYACIKLWYL